MQEHHNQHEQDYGNHDERQRIFATPVKSLPCHAGIIANSQESPAPAKRLPSRSGFIAFMHHRTSGVFFEHQQKQA